MGRSASEASTPLSSSLRVLPACSALWKLSAPPRVERAPSGLTVLQRIQRLSGHGQFSPPRESLSSWIDRWDYETRILEVDGVLLAAPHTAP
jgi:hypothetical protein